VIGPPSASCKGGGEEADVDWPGSGYLFRGREFDVVTRQFPPAPFGTVGAANSLLGFIGIARIRTVIGIHQVVPFGPDHLIVFRPCFRLVAEHGRHCWGIFIDQNRAQHPDLGFHVVVFRERLRIPSSSHKAKATEARMPIPCDDHMVVDSDTKQPANFDNLLGHVDIGPRWGGVAGRVIVDEHAAGGV
jgi:hypothetical protein